MKKIIYIPGVNEDTQTELAQILSKILNSKLYVFKPWNSLSELENMTLREVQNSLLKKLKNIENENIILAGRSFGAGIILTLNENLSKKRILFAPAIQVSQKDNFNLDTKFKHIQNFFINNISKKTIELYKGKTLIIHDPDDEKIPFSNSVKITKSPNITLIKSKSGHSFREDKTIIEDIKKFLS